MRSFSIALLVAAMLILTACAGPNPYGASSQSYTESEANQNLQVTRGTIIDVQAVTINSEGNIVGKAAGGLIGGIAGSSVGGGRGQAVATVAGAVIGGVIGNKAEAMYNKTNGVQITVQLDNGQVQAVVQKTNPNVFFRKGDYVTLISDVSGKTRVIQ